MATQPLKSIGIEGFTSIRSATVALGQLNILVGANGAGKSNFVQALELLGRIVDGELGLFVGLNGGASALLTGDGSARARAPGDPAGRRSRAPAGPDRGARHPAAQRLRGLPLPRHQCRRTGEAAGADGRQPDTAQRRGQLVAPFFRDFVLRPDSNDRILLRWQQQDSDAVFSGNQMSDGTLRFVCLATLLLQPELPALVVLDEPELGLHPFAIVQLAGLLRQASARSQVLIATQSVTLMNQFEIEDLIVVERKAGASEFTRPDLATLQEWLDEYSLGELWEKNLLGGRPGREEPAGA
ncbi:AAA family ATPase [Amycolatopsis sp. cg9]|uniref:AAA family ATPase n=1 Tax=Amycolatopsis sp. cg9 TaxID=3238801 RepID=UPI003523CE86